MKGRWLTRSFAVLALLVGSGCAEEPKEDATREPDAKQNAGATRGASGGSSGNAGQGSASELTTSGAKQGRQGAGASRPASAKAGVLAVRGRVSTPGREDNDSALFGWSHAGRGKSKVEMLAAIRRTKNGSELRLERKEDGKTRVFKANDGGCFEQLAAGVSSVTAVERATIARIHLLLGTLLAWDLDTKTRFDGDRLLSRAEWWSMGETPSLRRLATGDGQLFAIDLSCPAGCIPAETKAREYALQSAQEFAGRGGRIPLLEGEACAAFLLAAKRGSKKIAWTRYDVGASFADTYFALEVTPRGEQSNGLIEYGGERRNFEAALLEFVPEAQALSLPDPGPAWKPRLDKLLSIGKQLHELGQRSAGLPAYHDGKMHIYFLPADGQEAKAPKGMIATKRKSGHALVLHCLANLEAAGAVLGPKLRAEAARRKLAPAGPLRLIAFVLPGSELPKANAAICIRGELPVR